MVDGNLLIVNVSGLGSSIVALDKSTGRELWKMQSDEAGYSSAVAVDIGGVRQYLLFTREAAVGVLATNGELLWRYSPVGNTTANVATTVVRDNLASRPPTAPVVYCCD